MTGTCFRESALSEVPLSGEASLNEAQKGEHCIGAEDFVINFIQEYRFIGKQSLVVIQVPNHSLLLVVSKLAAHY